MLACISLQGMCKCISLVFETAPDEASCLTICFCFLPDWPGPVQEPCWGVPTHGSNVGKLAAHAKGHANICSYQARMHARGTSIMTITGKLLHHAS